MKQHVCDKWTLYYIMLISNLVPRAFPSKNFLREKPWGRGWLISPFYDFGTECAFETDSEVNTFLFSLKCQ